MARLIGKGLKSRVQLRIFIFVKCELIYDFNLEEIISLFRQSYNLLISFSSLGLTMKPHNRKLLHSCSITSFQLSNHELHSHFQNCYSFKNNFKSTFLRCNFQLIYLYNCYIDYISRKNCPIQSTFREIFVL